MQTVTHCALLSYPFEEVGHLSVDYELASFDKVNRLEDLFELIWLDFGFNEQSRTSFS